MKELETIVDDSAYNPAIDQTAFPGTPALNFRTSSAGTPTNAWLVDFYFGYASQGGNLAGYLVRCVR